MVSRHVLIEIIIILQTQAVYKYFIYSLQTCKICGIIKSKNLMNYNGVLFPGRLLQTAYIMLLFLRIFVLTRGKYLLKGTDYR